MTEITPKNILTIRQSILESKQPLSHEHPMLRRMAARVGLDSSAKEQILPARQAEPALYRQFLNLDLADTQQEREQIEVEILSSVKKEPDPVVIERMANRLGLNRYEEEDISNIILTKEEPDILSGPPVKITTPTPIHEGKKVFTDQNKWDQIMSEAPEELDPMSFRNAFKRARIAGKEEFEYKGDRFNTREKGESGKEWAQYLLARQTEQKIAKLPTLESREATRRIQRISAYKTSLLPIYREQPVKEEFSTFMNEAGVKVAEGKKVDTTAISSKVGPALNIISPILQNAGIVPEITSGKRDKGDWSLHEIGEAIDLRLKNATSNAITLLKNTLQDKMGKSRTVQVHGEKGQLWTDGEYEYVIHGTSNNIHIHIEREAEETKDALASHLIAIGKEKNISRKGLVPYPNLLKKYFPENM